MPNISISINAAPTPNPITPPGPLDFLLHDDASADVPRFDFAPDGYLPRTYRDKHNPSLPETTKRNSHTFPVTADWGKLDLDLIAHFAPAHILTDPPKGILREEDLKGYVVPSRLIEIYLRLNHGNLYKTNKTGWNDADFYDPLTGAGNQSGKPFRREDLTLCGNVVWSLAFGDLDGNTVPIVFVCANPNMPKMDWNGLHLRQIALEATRVKRLVGAIPSPYQR